MTIRSWLADRMFGSLIEERIQQAVKVLDDDYWQNISGDDPHVRRPWFERREQLEQIYITARTNPLAQRIISLTTDFVVGDTVAFTGSPYAQALWDDPQNRMSQRIYRWCDELTRSGELFIVLSRNAAGGMHYVRELPALMIDQIEIDQDDAETEHRYHQLTNDADGRWWPSRLAPLGTSQVMLHYAINKPVGETRGSSDLAQVVNWLDRYDMWLEDRVRINRYKGAYLWHVTIENALPATIKAKRQQYSRPPSSGSIIVSDSSERWEAISPSIDAHAVEADGKALRLMIAAGSGIPLHFLGEGESATRATAREMGTATFRHFAHRQAIFAAIVQDVIRTACQRAGQPDLAELTLEPIMSEDERLASDATAATRKAPQPEVENA